MGGEARELPAAIGADLREEGVGVELQLGDGSTLDRLRVALGKDDAGRDLEFELMVLPETASTAILQSYVGLPSGVEPSALPVLYRFLSEVNAVALIAAFGYVAPEDRLYLRHNLPVSLPDFDAVAVSTNLSLAATLVGALGPFMERVGRGEDVEAVLEALAEVVAADVRDAGFDGEGLGD